MNEPLYAQTLRNTYRFYNSLATIEADCGEDLQPLKGLNKMCQKLTAPTSGQFVSDSFPTFHLVRSVYQNNLNWGLRYANSDGIIEKTYTIQMYIKVFNFNEYYTRIIDFSDGVEDNGIYFTNYNTPQPAAFRCLNFFPQGNYGVCPFFNSREYYLLTLTRDDVSKQIYVYVNNLLFAFYKDDSNFYTSEKAKPVLIFRDDPIGFACEDGQANFAYLSFTNVFSSQQDIDSVYKNLGKIIESDVITTSTDTACVGEPIGVMYTPDSSAHSPDNTFVWEWDGGSATLQNDSSYQASWNAPGTKMISLQVTGGPCHQIFSYTKAIQIASDVKPQLSGTYTLCKGDTLDLYPGDYTRYQWQDGSDQSHYFVTATGPYSVTVTNRCLTATAHTYVKEARCYPVFPTAFTPNNDNLNDNFKQAEPFKCFTYRLQIYNRYGQVVFETHSPLGYWNVNFKEASAPAGTYTWQCTYQRTSRDKEIRLYGSVVIIR